LSCWIRFWIPSPDPDQSTLMNSDPKHCLQFFFLLQGSGLQAARLHRQEVHEDQEQEMKADMEIEMEKKERERKEMEEKKRRQTVEIIEELADRITEELESQLEEEEGEETRLSFDSEGA
jgi:hypothetical protein